MQHHNLSFILPRRKHTLSFPIEEATTVDSLFAPGIYRRKHVMSTLEENMYTLLNTTLTSHEGFKHFNYTIDEHALNLTIFRTSTTSDDLIRRYEEEEHHILNLLQLGSNVLQLYQDMREGPVAILDGGRKMSPDFYKRGMWLQQQYLYETGSITNEQLAFWLEENKEFKNKEPPLTINYQPLLLN